MYDTPMPAPGQTSITLSPFRRPSIDTMPVDAKAGCLYPNNARALVEAGRRGFDNCLLRDLLGNIAELGTANVFMAKDGVVYTPISNGTFLNGITRQRVIGLLREAGVDVREAVLSYDDFVQADEIWSCGNYAKVAPITRIAPVPFRRACDFGRRANCTGNSRTDKAVYGCRETVTVDCDHRLHRDH